MTNRVRADRDEHRLRRDSSIEEPALGLHWCFGGAGAHDGSRESITATTSEDLIGVLV